MRLPRCACALSLLLAAGCPGASEGPARGDGGPDGDGGAGGDGGTCEIADTCALVFAYPADGADSVELRGDFAPDGWEQGIPLERDGDSFRVSIEAVDGQAIQYKFVVDGDWVTDPFNPDQVGDGGGQQNSVVTADCNACDDDAVDCRDGIL